MIQISHVLFNRVLGMKFLPALSTWDVGSPMTFGNHVLIRCGAGFKRLVARFAIERRSPVV
jgi:hypothetical protein